MSSNPADELDYLYMRDLAIRLGAELRALKVAAWDVHEVVQNAMETPEDADVKAIRAALDVMGELIPAERPTVRETVDER